MTKTVTCVDINGKEYKVSVDKLKWRPSVYGLIIQGDKVLLVPQFGGYDLPGGGVDLGETLEDALMREIKEETGLDAANPRLLTAENSFFKAIHAKPPVTTQTIMLYYRCDVVGGKLSTEGFDKYEKEYASLAEWVAIDKLGSINVVHSYDWRILVEKITKS